MKILLKYGWYGGTFQEPPIYIIDYIYIYLPYLIIFGSMDFPSWKEWFWAFPGTWLLIRSWFLSGDWSMDQNLQDIRPVSPDKRWFRCRKAMISWKMIWVFHICRSTKGMIPVKKWSSCWAKFVHNIFELDSKVLFYYSSLVIHLQDDQFQSQSCIYIYIYIYI